MDVRKGNACLRVVCIKQVKLDILAFVLPESFFVAEVQQIELVWGRGNNFFQPRIKNLDRLIHSRILRIRQNCADNTMETVDILGPFNKVSIPAKEMVWMVWSTTPMTPRPKL